MFFRSQNGAKCFSKKTKKKKKKKKVACKNYFFGEFET